MKNDKMATTAKCDKCMVTGKKKKKVDIWSQSTRTGDVTKEVRVEKLFNEGFLVEYSVHGTDEDGNWFDEGIKTYSETNPLDADGETDELSEMFGQLSRN